MMIEKKNGEREREREIDDTCYNCEPNCRGEQSCFYCKVVFFRNNEIKNYFCVMSWTSYKFEWLGTLIFCFE